MPIIQASDYFFTIFLAGNASPEQGKMVRLEPWSFYYGDFGVPREPPSGDGDHKFHFTYFRLVKPSFSKYITGSKNSERDDYE